MAVPDHHFASFGMLLKDFRTRQRFTQQQLAEAIGVHRSAVNRWEQGAFLPKQKGIVLELAKHLRLNDQETRYLLEASLTALAPHWSVPFPRNPFFTGREEILEVLHTQLSTNRVVALTQSYALQGLGGVGKTQLALEYAYHHALEYSAVFWIGAENGENIISSLRHIAEVLQLPSRDDKGQQRVVTEIQHWLTTHSQWLLIWDNVEDLNLLDRFFSPTRQGTTLITTRCQVLGTFAQGIDLLPMEREEGMLFLLRRAKVLAREATGEQVRQLATQKPSQYTAAAELVTIMAGLPLALDQAGAYIEETRCNLPTYLELFRTRRATLLKLRGEGLRHHPDSVSTTFTLALKATAERHPAVQDLLQVCALLHPEAIPEELLRQGAEYLGAQLRVTCCDTLEWNRVVAIACSYSLLCRQAEEQTLSIHRLVQAVLLDTMTEAERARWQQRIVTALDTVFPKVLSTTEQKTWKQCERLLPHALLCLSPTSAPAPQESLPVASLGYKVASCLIMRGQYTEAKPLLQQALFIQERVQGPEHPDVASLLNTLANLYREQGQYAEAEPLFERALHIWEQRLGLEHPTTILALNNLALLYKNQGRYAEAEPLFERALHIWEQRLGPEHPDVARPLNNLAVLYWEQGKYAEAEPLFERALRIWEQRLGLEHPDVARALNNLAVLYWERCKYSEAELFFTRALRIWEQAWGPEHPNVAHALNGMAWLYKDQGRHAEAERLFLRVLRMREKILGSEHPDVASPLDGLAGLYVAQKNYEQAEPLYQRALRISEQHLGATHPDVAEPLEGLASFFREQGKYTQAELLYQRALSIREQRLGLVHPETAQILYDLAILRQKQGHVGESISFAEQALSIRLQFLGSAHPKTVVTQVLSAQLVQKQAGAEVEAPSERGTGGIADLSKEEHGMEKASPALPQAIDSSPFENDPLQAFLTACCELHPRAWCRSVDLWQAYTQWAADYQERYPLSRGAFIAQLKKHSCRADRTMSARIWRGIALVKNNA